MSYYLQDLQQKNANLQNIYDQMKNSLTEQISGLQIKLDETIKKSLLNEKILEDEFKLKIKRITSEKDNEMKTKLFVNEETERVNRELTVKLNDSYKEIAEVKNYYKGLISDMDYKLKIKEKEYFDLKSSYDDKINFCTSNFEEDKFKLIKSYEDNYENLSKVHKDSKEKLNSIIYQKEIDYKNLMDKFKDEEHIAETKISDFRKDLHKTLNENDNIKTKLSHYDNDIEKLHKTLDKAKKDNNFMMNEIKTLELENKNLVIENQEFKISQEKLNGIIYGKMKGGKNNSLSSKNVAGKNKLEGDNVK